MIALADVWDRWHLNDMQACTVKQRDHLKAIGHKGDYASAKVALTAVGLNPDRGYDFGSAWLYEPLPESILEVWAKAKAAMDKNLKIVEVAQRMLDVADLLG